MEQNSQPSVPDATPEAEAAPPDRTQEWPTARAEKGKFYAAPDPMHPDDMLCVMLMETWTIVGTVVKNQEVTMKTQHNKIQELLAANQSFERQVSSLNEALNNLRTVRRAEKRQELEGELILPGQREYFTNPKSKS